MDRVERIFQKVTQNLHRDTMEDKSWVASVIASCFTLSHLTYLPTLINLFEKKHQDYVAAAELERLYQLKKYQLTHNG